MKDHVMLHYFQKKKGKKEKKNLISSECESFVNVRFQHVCKFAKTLNDKEEFRK